MIKNKYGISGIVAITLLVLVTVVVGVGFQVWYTQYSSGLLTKNDVSGNSAINPAKLDKIVGKTLYIKNPSGNLSVNKVRINGVDCGINGSFSGELAQIELPTLCINAIDSNRMPEVVLEGSNLLLSKRVDYKFIGINCELNGMIIYDRTTTRFYNSSDEPCYSILRTCSSGNLSGDINYNYTSCIVSNPIDCPLPWVGGGNLSHSLSTTAYQSSSVPFGNTCVSESRTCANGVLSGSYEYESCSVLALSTSLSCSTDFDGDGFISYLCAIYPMTELSFEGHLDANDNNATITVDMSCVFNNDKSGCLSNYVIDGCGSETVLDVGTGLCWDRNFNRNAGTLDWINAKDYCDNLNTHPSGHSDWYLPSRQEFETIVDLTRTAPHIAGGNNNKFTSVQSYYWTKTTYGPSTTGAFIVFLSDGNSLSNVKTGNYYVACVRRD